MAACAALSITKLLVSLRDPSGSTVYAGTWLGVYETRSTSFCGQCHSEARRTLLRTRDALRSIRPESGIPLGMPCKSPILRSR